MLFGMYDSKFNKFSSSIFKIFYRRAKFVFAKCKSGTIILYIYFEIIFKMSVHVANKFENTRFYILRCFDCQNYLLIIYCMFFNTEICICMNLKSALVH